MGNLLETVNWSVGQLTMDQLDANRDRYEGLVKQGWVFIIIPPSWEFTYTRGYKSVTLALVSKESSWLGHRMCEISVYAPGIYNYSMGSEKAA